MKSPHPTTRPIAKGVMCPPNGSTLRSEKVKIVAVVDGSGTDTHLTVDGKSIGTNRFRLKRLGQPSGYQCTALIATMKLNPGQHVIKVGTEASKIWIDASGKGGPGPSSWREFQAHPPNTDNCRLCHEVSEADGMNVLGVAKEPVACFACHERDLFGFTHSHRLESLAACQMCHAPHGGSQEALLIDKPKVLCTKCHE